MRGAALFDRVIAAEAAQATFAELEADAGLLPNVALHQVAIHSVSGKHLTFVNVANSHASARLLSDGKSGPGEKTETVVTRRIDDLVPKGVPVLINLDVEGAEVEALKGASHALQEGAVIIYEDHGSDPTCAPSGHLLSMPETCLFFSDDRFSQVTSLDQVRASKTDPYKGYNLLAAHKESALLARILERL